MVGCGNNNNTNHAFSYLALTEAGVDGLKDANSKGTGLASARLGLGDGVTALDNRHNGALLDGAGLLKAVRVDAAQQVLAETHVVERLYDLLPVRLDDGAITACTTGIGGSTRGSSSASGTGSTACTTSRGWGRGGCSGGGGSSSSRGRGRGRGSWFSCSSSVHSFWEGKQA